MGDWDLAQWTAVLTVIGLLITILGAAGGWAEKWRSRRERKNDVQVRTWPAQGPSDWDTYVEVSSSTTEIGIHHINLQLMKEGRGTETGLALTAKEPLPPTVTPLKRGRGLFAVRSMALAAGFEPEEATPPLRYRVLVELANGRSIHSPWERLPPKRTEWYSGGNTEPDD